MVYSRTRGTKGRNTNVVAKAATFQTHEGDGNKNDVLRSLWQKIDLKSGTTSAKQLSSRNASKNDDPPNYWRNVEFVSPRQFEQESQQVILRGVDSAAVANDIKSKAVAATSSRLEVAEGRGPPRHRLNSSDVDDIYSDDFEDQSPKRGKKTELRAGEGAGAGYGDIVSSEDCGSPRSDQDVHQDEERDRDGGNTTDAKEDVQRKDHEVDFSTWLARLHRLQDRQQWLCARPLDFDESEASFFHERPHADSLLFKKTTIGRREDDRLACPATWASRLPIPGHTRIRDDLVRAMETEEVLNYVDETEYSLFSFYREDSDRREGKQEHEKEKDGEAVLAQPSAAQQLIQSKARVSVSPSLHSSTAGDITPETARDIVVEKEAVPIVNLRPNDFDYEGKRSPEERRKKVKKEWRERDIQLRTEMATLLQELRAHRAAAAREIEKRRKQNDTTTRFSTCGPCRRHEDFYFRDSGGGPLSTINLNGTDHVARHRGGTQTSFQQSAVAKTLSRDGLASQHHLVEEVDAAEKFEDDDQTSPRTQKSEPLDENLHPRELLPDPSLLWLEDDRVVAEQATDAHISYKHHQEDDLHGRYDRVFGQPQHRSKYGEHLITKLRTNLAAQQIVERGGFQGAKIDTFVTKNQFLTDIWMKQAEVAAYLPQEDLFSSGDLTRPSRRGENNSKGALLTKTGTFTTVAPGRGEEDTTSTGDDHPFAIRVAAAEQRATSSSLLREIFNTSRSQRPPPRPRSAALL
ncbi:unnamed protein product [Amoebophrya sp. A25]|nr:unnamed protein product [Amoebophrya sp. A25]|eukprot:GSA25T00016593001.1